MVRSLIVIAPLLLCGCEDAAVSKAVASCTIDALKIHPESRAGDTVIYEYVQLCMTAAGYLVDTDDFTCSNDNRGVSCYHSREQHIVEWFMDKLRGLKRIASL